MAHSCQSALTYLNGDNRFNTASTAVEAGKTW